MPTYEDAGLVPVFSRGVRQGVLSAGICSVLLGTAVVLWPDKTVPLIGLLFGMYLLAGAVALGTVAFGARLGKVPKVLLFGAAVASAILAVLCFRSGNWVLLPAMWIGLAWAVRGVAHAIAAVWEDDEVTGSARQETFGLVTLLAGMMVAIAPFESVGVLAVLAGLCMITFGIMEILTAVRAPLVEDVDQEAEAEDEAAQLPS